MYKFLFTTMASKKKPFKGLLFAVLLSCAGHTPLVLAKEKGYFEMAYMNLDMELTSNTEKHKAKPPGLQMRLGTTFQKYVGLEGMFAFGVGSDDFTPNERGRLNTLFGANLLGLVSLADKADLFARVGFAQMDVKIGDDSFDDTGVMYALGFDIRVSRYGAITMEYSRLPDIELNAGAQLKTNSINLGYRLRF